GGAAPAHGAGVIGRVAVIAGLAVLVRAARAARAAAAHVAGLAGGPRRVADHARRAVRPGVAIAALVALAGGQGAVTARLAVGVGRAAVAGRAGAVPIAAAAVVIAPVAAGVVAVRVPLLVVDEHVATSEEGEKGCDCDEAAHAVLRSGGGKSSRRAKR